MEWNNLIFYGISNDPSETSESLIAKMQVRKLKVGLTESSYLTPGPVEGEAAAEEGDRADPGAQGRHRPGRLGQEAGHSHLRELQVKLSGAVTARLTALVCFRDREAVLRRAEYLKKCNMHVTEDFSKSVREQRAHLSR